MQPGIDHLIDTAKYEPFHQTDIKIFSDGAFLLPDFDDLAQRSYVYDSSGREIAVFEVENSQPISLADVPDQVVDAFLAVEDNEFWVHHGVNVRSLFRATLSNFASDAPQQGASTITMQVVKNDFLAGLERDGRYKLLQIHYARMLEKELSKEQILQRYLNTFAGISLRVDGWPGEKTSDAMQAVFGFRLKGDPRG